ncbi:MAG: hypothetical protein QM488_19990 [Rhizobiaceae bacterium]
MRHKAHDRIKVLKKYRLKLERTTRQLMRDNKAWAPDRSSRVFAMVAGLHEARASLDKIASVIWSSPYFQDKYPDNVDALHAEISRIMSKIGGAS